MLEALFDLMDVERQDACDICVGLSAVTWSRPEGERAAGVRTAAADATH